MESVTTIDSVDPKQVKTKYGVKTVWNVSCADGRLYSTFKDEIGKTAGTLRGQTVTVSFSERPWQKDDKSGVNYDLDDVKAAEELTEPPSVTLGAGLAASANPVIFTASGGTVTHNISAKPYVDDKSKQINRSVAFKAAVELIGPGAYDSYETVVSELAKLTELLIPVVEGTTPAPFEPPTGQSIGVSGETEIVAEPVDSQGNLVTF